MVTVHYWIVSIHSLTAIIQTDQTTAAGFVAALVGRRTAIA